MTLAPLFLRSQELAGLQEVKRQVEAQLDQAPSILHLSGIAFINERKLLAAFKQVFHTTIYEYYLTLKMQINSSFYHTLSLFLCFPVVCIARYQVVLITGFVFYKMIQLMI